MLLMFPRRRAHGDHAPTMEGCVVWLDGARAAKRASSSAVTPACLAVSVLNREAHHSAGIVSRCGHLRTAETPAPISAANASGEGHSPTTSRKEQIIGPFLGQSVLICKPTLSRDGADFCGQNVPMANASAYKAAFMERIRDARTARGLTQEGIAILLGITQDTYKQYETRSYLPHQLVPRFCLACGIDPAWLFDADGKLAAKAPPRPHQSRRRRVA